MSAKVHVPGVLKRQMVEPKVPRGLGVEGGSPSDQPHAMQLGDTLERSAPDRPQSKLDHVLYWVIGAGIAGAVALGAIQWATGLTDDIRGARDDSNAMIQKCGGRR